MITSAFAQFRDQAWPYQFAATLAVRNIVGGTPSDPHVGEAFIRSKLAGSEDLIREAVAAVMSERGIDAETAAKEVDNLKHLNGFKRDGHGLYIEGRQVKAAIKEAASIAGAAGKLPLKKWGLTGKSLLGFIAEHVCVDDDRVHLGKTEPDLVLQKFVHTWRGSGIQYEECVTAADLNFTVKTDWEFTGEQWAMIWLTGEEQGLGASRSQGFGKYTVTRWEARTEWEGPGVDVKTMIEAADERRRAAGKQAR